MLSQTAEALTSSLSATEFRDGMARLAAAVNIITTNGTGGLAGFTASAVCSVTDTPPTLLVCLNRSSSAYGAFTTNRSVCVNALSGGQEGLSRIFGGRTPMQERFAAALWRSGRTGAPILEDAVVSFDCRVASVSRVGTHDVLFCEVMDVVPGRASDALLYAARRYHTILY